VKKKQIMQIIQIMWKKTTWRSTN